MKHKPGLWEMTTVQGSSPPSTLKACMDEKTDELFSNMIGGLQKSKCPDLQVHTDGSKITSDGVCKLGATQATLHGVVVFQGNTSYQTDTHAHYDPPLMGKTDVHITETGKWVGACGADMQPGDVVMPGGQKINLNKLNMGGAKTN
jgi:hypothetical protein